ncbi:MAG: CpXC domain-containing protein [Spirochaetales bacterium]|nr:CpXC domain-containing protein [Spirochaetales bacterium]
MIELTCLCENKFSADIRTEYDTDASPGIVNDILSGRFMSVSCPSCGKLLKPEFPTHITSKKNNWDIQFVPELERVSFLKNLPTGKKGNKRIVIGYPELLEKIKIFSDRLNDQVVEYLKYNIMSKLLEKSDENETENDINVYYNERKEDALLFHIQGLKSGEVGLFKVPMGAYEQAVQEIDTKINSEPFNEFLTPPYVSLNRLFTWDDV